ncbi:hypothetical protein [Prosthecobacter vanneervenii]|uniref:Uncharacterized protein n=1 Tax=Prosthecobacter vanneervenii TaxID=48466 RepID=A0A7W7YCM3_9BACT|nr:hypothetical protein [Prosthecobacter vanneervenii]MBB5033567.1 hypothetical protein [Prosthecobacter vanneervenii]
MGNRASELDLQMSPSLDLGDSSGDMTSGGAEAEVPVSEAARRLETLIEAELPEELRSSARGLLRAVVNKVAVPGHFDAFCCQAFAKPEWAAVSSRLIAEMFEEDEDQLAEMARIPDLVIEMSSGEVSVTCMVASRWAARGETHRLSRLADAIVASHAAKNVHSVDIMLALAATLAVTRFSRAEQLFNAAQPLATEEHQEPLADARRWLAAGRVVCSAAQDERDFWDLRLRRPKTAWSWHNKAELEALDHLSEWLTADAEGADLYKAILPQCWWGLAMKFAQAQDKLAQSVRKPEQDKAESPFAIRTPVEAPPSQQDLANREFRPHPQATPLARFLLPWFCGCLAMILTVLVLPREFVVRILDTLKPRADITTQAELTAWRNDTLKQKAAELALYTPQHDKAKTGSWSENEETLTGRGKEMPFESSQYMQLLVWLHLDPPNDAEVRRQVCYQLLKRVKADAISLWELLLYPGSSNADEIKAVAREALADPSYSWSADEKKRLGMIIAHDVTSHMVSLKPPHMK